MAEKIQLGTITIDEEVTPTLAKLSKKLEEFDNHTLLFDKTVETAQSFETLTRSAMRFANLPLGEVGAELSNGIHGVLADLPMLDKGFTELENIIGRVGSTISNAFSNLASRFTPITNGISTAFQNVASRISPIFNTISTSATSAFSRITSTISRVTSPITQVFGEIGTLAGRGFGKAQQALSSFSKSISGVFSVVKLLGSTVVSAIQASIENLQVSINNLRGSIITISEGISALFEQGDTQRDYEYRISIFADGVTNSAELRDQLTQAALNSYTDLETLSDLASGIMISGATGGDTEKAIKLSENISKAMTASGASTEEVARSTRQLKQALSSGILQGDELRAIREQTPGLMVALASGIREMAKAGEIESKYANIAAGDLKQLGADGVLTSELVVRAMELGGEATSEMFEQMPVTWGRVTTQLATLGQNMWAKITDKGTVFGHMMSKALEGVNSLVKAFQENSDMINKFFEGINTGMQPVLAVFTIIGEQLNKFVEGLNDTEEQLNNAMRAGEMFGTMITTVLGIAALSMLGFAINTLIALAPLLLIVGLITAVGVAITKSNNQALTFQNILTNTLVGAMQLVQTIGVHLLDAILTVATGAFVIATGIVTCIEYGEALAVTFSNGIVAGVYSVIAVLLTMVSAFQGAFGSVVSAIGQALNNITNKIADIVDGLNEISSYIGITFDVSGLRGVGSDWGQDLITASANTSADAQAYWDKIDSMSQETADAWATATENIANFQNTGTEFIYTLGEARDGFENITDDIIGGIEDTVASGFENMPALNDILNNGTNTEGMYSDMFGDIADSVADTATSSGQTAKNTSDKSVELSDDDIEYLRSIAARDFMVVVNTKAPKITNTFGDVRETADVDSILNTITDMVENQLAVSLVS